MKGEVPRVVHQREFSSPRPRSEARSPWTSSKRTAVAEASEVRRLAEAVGRCILFDTAELPNEFFPAHLSVAIIEAVFRFQPESEEQSTQVAQRYCRRLGLVRMRRSKFELPPIDEQETLADLIGHYDELGEAGMTNEVFETSCRFPGTAMRRAETVVQIAQALRHIGVDVLQDMQHRSVQVLDAVRSSVLGSVGSMSRMILTYAGDDDLVVADDHVRRFVAEATGHPTVSASWAAHLVCQTAYERVLSPRHLDYRIYRYCAQRESITASSGEALKPVSAHGEA